MFVIMHTYNEILTISMSSIMSSPFHVINHGVNRRLLEIIKNGSEFRRKVILELTLFGQIDRRHIDMTCVMFAEQVIIGKYK